MIDNGLKFAPRLPPRSAIIKEIAASTETILQNISRDKKYTFSCNKLINIFHRHNNVYRDTHAVSDKVIITNIKNKVKQHDLIVSKADKGNSTIIMKKLDYISATKTFLSNNNFTLLNKSPLNNYQEKLRKVLRNSGEMFEFLEQTISKYFVSNPKLPRLYSLIKIHKNPVSIRPIVSFINSPAYNIAKFLGKVLPQLIDFKSSFTIKNTSELTKTLQQVKIPDNSVLISFDVVNLFPNVPVNECLDILRSTLAKTGLSDVIVSQIYKLLCIVLQQDFFSFDNCIYKQNSGLAMGSPLSPFLAEIFLSNIEKTMISKLPSFRHVVKWMRYVDDVLVVFSGSKDDIHSFFTALNTIHTNLKFTMEQETNAGLPFLDLYLTRKQNKIVFSIFRKPTTTDHIIPSHSIHPLEHKTSSFHSLLTRLFSVPMNDTNFKKELDTIKVIALRNGYSLEYLKNIYNKISKRITQKHITALKNDLEKRKEYFTFPYVPDLSDKIRQFFKHYKINISFRSPSTLKNMICAVSEPVNLLSFSGVYRVECSCNAFYIGRTFRSIQTRISEHLRLTKSANNLMKLKSTFANHLYTEGHKIDGLPRVKVLHRLFKNSKTDLNNLEVLEILLSNKQDQNKLLNDILDFDNIFILKRLINLDIF